MLSTELWDKDLDAAGAGLDGCIISRFLPAPLLLAGTELYLELGPSSFWLYLSTFLCPHGVGTGRRATVVQYYGVGTRRLAQRPVLRTVLTPCVHVFTLAVKVCLEPAYQSLLLCLRRLLLP